MTHSKKSRLLRVLNPIHRRFLLAKTICSIRKSIILINNNNQNKNRPNCHNPRLLQKSNSSKNHLKLTTSLRLMKITLKKICTCTSHKVARNYLLIRKLNTSIIEIPCNLLLSYTRNNSTIGMIVNIKRRRSTST